MKDVVARLQRELPDTDKDRYDIAYQRGRAQARSGLLFGGLALGSAIGAGLMWLLDPVRGAGRRTDLSQRLTSLTNDLSKSVGGKATDLQNRAQGFAIEKGIKQPDEGGGETRSGSGAAHPGSYAESTVGRQDPVPVMATTTDATTADDLSTASTSRPFVETDPVARTSVVSPDTEEQEAAAGR